MKLLLTSAGIKNKTIAKALFELVGKNQQIFLWYLFLRVKCGKR